jgi:hypothetical protein
VPNRVEAAGWRSVAVIVEGVIDVAVSLEFLSSNQNRIVGPNLNVGSYWSNILESSNMNNNWYSEATCISSRLHQHPDFVNAVVGIFTAYCTHIFRNSPKPRLKRFEGQISSELLTCGSKIGVEADIPSFER